MFKKSLIALAVVAVAAASAPAFASADPLFNASTSDQLDFAKTALINQLKDRGVNATDVDAWGQYIRADVTLANGTQAVRFFQPDSLQPVDISHLN
jgi:hypothetical protein